MTKSSFNSLFLNPFFQMHLAIFLWGFTGILGKAIDMSEGAVVWYRLLITSLSLFLFLLIKKKFEPITLKELVFVGFIGLIVTVHWLLFYGAIKLSNVSVALSCFASIGLFTAILEPLYKRQRPAIREVIFGSIALIGVSVIFKAQSVFGIGIVMALGSAFLGAIFTILNKKLLEKHTSETIVFYEIATGFIIMTILLPGYFSIDPLFHLKPSQLDLFYLIILSVVCTTFAFTISLHALKKVSAFTMNLSVNLEPIYSIILAIIIFNEHKMLHSGFYFGALIIIGSVAAQSLNTYYLKKASDRIQI